MTDQDIESYHNLQQIRDHKLMNIRLYGIDSNWWEVLHQLKRFESVILMEFEGAA